MREKYDSEFEKYKEENNKLNEQLDQITFEKNTLQIRINEADSEFKEALIKEKQSRHIQKVLYDQIEKLKTEKGLNKDGINKDTLINKMKAQTESLKEKLDKLENEMEYCRLWSIKNIEMYKEERDYRLRIDD